MRYIEVTEFECEAGYGKRPENFHYFLAEDTAEKFCKERNSDIKSRFSSDYYWEASITHRHISWEQIEEAQKQKRWVKLHFDTKRCETCGQHHSHCVVTHYIEETEPVELRKGIQNFILHSGGNCIIETSGQAKFPYEQEIIFKLNSRVYTLNFKRGERNEN